MSGSSSAPQDKTQPQPKPAPDAKPAPDKDKKKPKKVWTEEDVTNLHGSVSVVGDPDRETNKNPRHAGNDQQPSSKEAARLREELRKLNAEMDATDKQIRDLKNFKAENTSSSGGIKLGGRYSMTSPQEQVKQLEEKKRQIQAKIDALEDEARKKGIEPGDLR